MRQGSRFEQTDRVKAAATRHSSALSTCFYEAIPRSWTWFECKQLNRTLGAALHALHVGLSLSDLAADDAPMVWLSRGFTTVNGYSHREAIGHNCRFLQADATDPASIRQLRAAVERGERARVHLYNEDRKRVGFWSVVLLHPAVGDDRIETNFGAPTLSPNDSPDVSRKSPYSTAPSSALPSPQHRSRRPSREHARYMMGVQLRLSGEELKVALDLCQQAVETNLADHATEEAHLRTIPDKTPPAFRHLHSQLHGHLPSTAAHAPPHVPSSRPTSEPPASSDGSEYTLLLESSHSRRPSRRDTHEEMCAPSTSRRASHESAPDGSRRASREVSHALARAEGWASATDAGKGRMPPGREAAAAEAKLASELANTVQRWSRAYEAQHGQVPSREVAMAAAMAAVDDALQGSLTSQMK